MRSLPGGKILSHVKPPNYSNKVECIETRRNNLSQVVYSFHFVLRKISFLD